MQELPPLTTLDHENIPLLLEKSREWAKIHTPIITKILTELTQKHRAASHAYHKLFQPLILLEGHLSDTDTPPPLGDDIFSNAVCDGLVDQFPDELLNGVTKHHGMVLKPSYGPGAIRRKGQHSFFSLGPVIIDPTSGIFHDLDGSISAHPHLFVGRILVGTQEQIEQAIGMTHLTS